MGVSFRFASNYLTKMSVDTVPKSMKQLRACLVCSLVKTFDQFESDGCDNCESVLHLKRNRDNVYDCTSSNFEVSKAQYNAMDSALDYEFIQQTS